MSSQNTKKRLLDHQSFSEPETKKKFTDLRKSTGFFSLTSSGTIIRRSQEKPLQLTVHRPINGSVPIVPIVSEENTSQKKKSLARASFASNPEFTDALFVHFKQTRNWFLRDLEITGEGFSAVTNIEFLHIAGPMPNLKKNWMDYLIRTELDSMQKHIIVPLYYLKIGWSLVGDLKKFLEHPILDASTKIIIFGVPISSASEVIPFDMNYANLHFEFESEKN
jgi:hypothetical protein